MEGYTAIVYAGTVDPEGSEDAEGPADLSDGQGEAGPTPHSAADGAPDGEGAGPEPLSEAERPLARRPTRPRLPRSDRTARSFPSAWTT